MSRGSAAAIVFLAVVLGVGYANSTCAWLLCQGTEARVMLTALAAR